jgi:hypothetical protein
LYPNINLKRLGGSKYKFRYKILRSTALEVIPVRDACMGCLCVGEGHEASEEENSGDDEQDGAHDAKPKKRHKKAKSGQAKKLFARGGFTEPAADWQKDLDSEHKQREEEKEKKKAEDIWAGTVKLS